MTKTQTYLFHISLALLLIATPYALSLAFIASSPVLIFLISNLNLFINLYAISIIPSVMNQQYPRHKRVQSFFLKSALILLTIRAVRMAFLYFNLLATVPALSVLITKIGAEYAFINVLLASLPMAAFGLVTLVSLYYCYKNAPTYLRTGRIYLNEFLKFTIKEKLSTILTLMIRLLAISVLLLATLMLGAHVFSALNLYFYKDMMFIAIHNSLSPVAVAKSCEYLLEQFIPVLLATSAYAMTFPRPKNWPPAVAVAEATLPSTGPDDGTGPKNGPPSPAGSTNGLVFKTFHLLLLKVFSTRLGRLLAPFVSETLLFPIPETHQQKRTFKTTTTSPMSKKAILSDTAENKEKARSSTGLVFKSF